MRLPVLAGDLRVGTLPAATARQMFDEFTDAAALIAQEHCRQQYRQNSCYQYRDSRWRSENGQQPQR